MFDRIVFALLVSVCLVLCAGCIDGETGHEITDVSCAVSVPANWSADVMVFMDGEESAFAISAAGDGRYLAGLSNGTIVSDDGRRYRIYYPAEKRTEVIPSTYAGAVWGGAGKPIRGMLYAFDLLKDALSDGNVTCTRTDGTIEIAGDGMLGFSPTRTHDAVDRIVLSVDPDTGEMQGLALLDPDGKTAMAVTFEHFTEIVIPDDAFSFVPPEGTETVMMRTYAVTPIFVTTLEAAERCCNVTFPDLPEGYAFVDGASLPGLSTVLVYQNNGGTKIRITYRPVDLPYPDTPAGQAETVAVNGRPGLYYRGNGTNTLVWVDNTTAFRIQGAAGQEEMMLVAASLGAPA